MDRTQKGVAIGMTMALLGTIVVFFLSVSFLPEALPLPSDTASRLGLAAWSALVPCLLLMFCIARLAQHRFFTPDDIHGSGLTSGSDRAKYLQALLQNTLEQTCMAVPVYAATGVLAAPQGLPMIPAAALLFLVGRLAFFAGYAGGAPARAFGFALTFYPTVILLACLLMRGFQDIMG